MDEQHLLILHQSKMLLTFYENWIEFLTDFEQNLMVVSDICPYTLYQGYTCKANCNEVS